MSVRVKLSIALVVVASAIGLLIAKEVTHASSYYTTVGQLKSGSYRANETITVSGNIVGETVSFDSAKQLLKFSIQDSQGNRTLPVLFHGAKPDDFSNGWPVIVTGHLSSNTFTANQILIKCPSKYSAKGSETWHAQS